ncbi:hypothetical protein [Pseudomonas indica]|uniref:hypothetical protein n=1 Tax=Pseudomonas indica TaxID=137658 RepID=UPI000BD815B1|nr:hypothetical protein [Pseudomonas indica]PAU64469.1 hypothetical protein BZL42_02100 [Pseudomonas indica]
MLRKFLTAFSAFISALLFSTHTYGAGWYDVKNYIGHIGAYPIHISLQRYEGFGSGIEFEGSYYYDNQLKPIPIYGRHNKHGDIELCEIHTADEFNSVLTHGSKDVFDTDNCQFALTFNEQGAKGIWRNNKKKYPVQLNLVGSLNNTDGDILNGIMEIPFWGQTHKHSFIGIYQSSDLGIEVIRIDIINKDSKKVVQQLNPQDNCDFGFTMTPIYMNVDGFYSLDGELVNLNCQNSIGGDYATYVFDEKLGRFIFK